MLSAAVVGRRACPACCVTAEGATPWQRLLQRSPRLQLPLCEPLPCLQTRGLVRTSECTQRSKQSDKHGHCAEYTTRRGWDGIERRRYAREMVPKIKSKLPCPLQRPLRKLRVHRRRGVEHGGKVHLACAFSERAGPGLGRCGGLGTGVKGPVAWLRDLMPEERQMGVNCRISTINKNRMFKKPLSLSQEETPRAPFRHGRAEAAETLRSS